MTWTLIDTAAAGEGELALYCQGDDGQGDDGQGDDRQSETFMIRANGFELMNGLGHQSETVLGRMAVAMARVPNAHILIGGLGLGYTLAAAAADLEKAGRITVVELSPKVIEWFDRYVACSVLPVRPPNLAIVPGDISAFMRRDEVGPFDVIVLDVDNGPEALVSPMNADLYTAKGLRALAAKLSPDGLILLWSAFESAEFVTCAENAGFAVTTEVLASIRRPDLFHYAYRLVPYPRCGSDEAGGAIS